MDKLLMGLTGLLNLTFIDFINIELNAPVSIFHFISQSLQLPRVSHNNPLGRERVRAERDGADR